MKMASMCLKHSKQGGGTFSERNSTCPAEQMTTSSEKKCISKGLGGGGGVLDRSIRGGEDKIHTKSMASLVFLFVD